MKNKALGTSVFTASLLLAGCGSSSSDSDGNSLVNESKLCTGDATYTCVVQLDVSAGGFGASGDDPANKYTYFDLDTGTALTLTDEEAKSNTAWDVAFKRVNTMLNGGVSGSGSVKGHFIGNNADFYDSEGNPVNEKFKAALPETEIEDFIAVTATDIPADDKFVEDTELLAIEGSGGWYSYNFTTHQFNVLDDHYWVIKSDDAFTRFRVTDVVAAQAGLASITLGVGFQGADDQVFAQEDFMEVNLANCTGDAFIDLNSNATVTESDSWDIKIPCSNGFGQYEIRLNDNASALYLDEDANNTVSATNIPPTLFKSDSTKSLFGDYPWYAYNVDGNHGIFSQYGVYLIKNTDKTYKLQIQNYYNASGSSGYITFVYEALN